MCVCVCVCVCLGVVSKCGDEKTAGFSSQEILRSRCYWRLVTVSVCVGSVVRSMVARSTSQDILSVEDLRGREDDERMMLRAFLLVRRG